MPLCLSGWEFVWLRYHAPLPPSYYFIRGRAIAPSPIPLFDAHCTIVHGERNGGLFGPFLWQTHYANQ